MGERRIYKFDYKLKLYKFKNFREGDNIFIMFFEFIKSKIPI